MTPEDIRRCELSYQIRYFLMTNSITKEQFAETSSLSLHKLDALVNGEEVSLQYNEITNICDALSISLDSLLYGPIYETQFCELIHKCSYAEEHQHRWFSKYYISYLKWWRKHHISDSLLKRYSLWSAFMDTPDSEYLWKRIKANQAKEEPVNRIGRFLGSSKLAGLSFATGLHFTKRISERKAAKLAKLADNSKTEK